MHELGYNYRITDFQCALGSNQLKKIQKFISKRKKIASIYNRSFSQKNYFTIPYVNKSVNHAYHIYPLCIEFKELNISKINFFNYMLKNKIKLQVHYIPVHLQPYYKSKYKFKNGDCPVSEKFYEQEISLPIYPKLKLVDQKLVISKITEYFNNMI